jgi:hypothetical protein
MKLFLSWSGELSKDFADAVKGWLEDIFEDHIQVFYSDSDVDAGQRWMQELKDNLNEAEFVILCLTSKNLTSPWINFEAGWMVRHLEQNSMLPLLLDLDPADVTGPLSQFQSTRADDDGMQSIARTINRRLGAKALKEKQLTLMVRGRMEELSKTLAPIIRGGTKSLQAEYLPNDTQADYKQIHESALSLIESARKSIDLMTTWQLFHQLSDENFTRIAKEDEKKAAELRILSESAYLKRIAEHVGANEQISFRQLVNFDPFNSIREESKTNPSSGRYLLKLIELRKRRKNINLRQTELFNHVLIIIDDSHVFVERMQSSSNMFGEPQSRDYLLGAQIIHDPVGNIAAGYSSEFSNIWDSGSNEVFWSGIESELEILEPMWPKVKVKTKSPAKAKAPTRRIVKKKA